MEALEEMVHRCAWPDDIHHHNGFHCRRERSAGELRIIFMGYFYLYYALGLPTFLFVVIALYLLFTGANFYHMLLLKNSCIPDVFFMCAQAPERRSTSASSSKSQVHTCGHRRELVFA